VQRRPDHRVDPGLIISWRRPCTVSVLLVTDGGLDADEVTLAGAERAVGLVRERLSGELEVLTRLLR
jgi:hypothetical protein